MNAKYNARKGRKLQNLVRNRLLKTFPHLKDNDVQVARTGENGPDIKLSRIAKRLIPFQWEIKSQQRMKTIYSWHRQASKNSDELTPIVVCKMNSREPLVILDFDNFIELIKYKPDKKDK